MPPSPDNGLVSVHDRPLSKARWLPWPKRIDLSLLCFFGLLIATCDRINIAVAAPAIMREYGWDTTQMGWALSGFYIGYVAFMVPAGILADRCGPKRAYAVGVGWWSVFTALTPSPRSEGDLEQQEDRRGRSPAQRAGDECAHTRRCYAAKITDREQGSAAGRVLKELDGIKKEVVKSCTG